MIELPFVLDQVNWVYVPVNPVLNTFHAISIALEGAVPPVNACENVFPETVGVGVGLIVGVGVAVGDTGVAVGVGVGVVVGVGVGVAVGSTGVAVGVGVGFINTHELQ